MTVARTTTTVPALAIAAVAAAAAAAGVVAYRLRAGHVTTAPAPPDGEPEGEEARS